MKIKILPKEVVAKIAAGEVIERPASVVKELVENSLDAKASFIQITIEDSGLKKIMVVDDGLGISAKDLTLAIIPHSTSKIRSDQDLLRIACFGFRGEALASIAAVSNLVLRSRTKKSLKGCQIEIVDDKREVSFLGMPCGTTVIVEDLLAKVPVRKKFLKKKSAEFHQIVELVCQYALAFPAIGFSLSHNGKNILQVNSSQTLSERVTQILGQDFVKQMFEVTAKKSCFELKGFLGRPQLAGKSKKKQFLFVNQRPIQNSLIDGAVKRAYSSLIEPDSNPPFILFLDLPVSMVDVNVHPRKQEVKFIQEQEIVQFVSSQVSSVLQENDLTFRPKVDLGKGGDAYTLEVLSEKVTPWSVTKVDPDSDIFQLDNTFLVVKTDHGLLVLDQHAAHERILYEQFIDRLDQVKKEKTTLSPAKVFDLPVASANVLKQNLSDFKKLGFEIEVFGDNTFKIISLPTIFAKRDIVSLLVEVLDDFLNQDLPFLDKNTKRTISYLACRSAIKAGDVLTKSQMKRLLKKLAATKTNYTCPHGRPVKIEISLADLEKMFRRK